MPEPKTHFITFLGTGNYQRVCYEWLDGRRIETALFPSAVPRFIPQIVSATAFVTEESEAKHGARFDAEWPTDWHPEHALIPKGSTPDELWMIFDRVVSAVPDDSRLVFDITHAFRSIPLISVLAVAYMWSTRDIQLQALLYGAFDAARGDPPVAPVFDLTPMINLLEWIGAVERFRHHLDGEPLQRLLHQIQRQAHQRGADHPPRQLQNAGNALKSLTDALLLGRVREVLRETPNLASTLAKPELREEAGRWAKPLLPMLEPLQSLLREIGTGSETDLHAHRRLAQFYSDRRLYPLAITLLREWIVSEACRRDGATHDELFEEERREQVESILGACFAAQRDKQPLPTEPTWIEQFAADGLLDLWSRVPGIRNDIDHAGMRRSPQPANRLILNVRALFSRPVQQDPEVPEMPDVVFYPIGVDRPIAPEEPLPPLPAVPRGALVVVEGRAPIWLYGLAFHRLHGSPAAAVAVYDPRLGAVVVASHHPDFREGQVIDVEPPVAEPPEGGTTSGS